MKENHAGPPGEGGGNERCGSPHEPLCATTGSGTAARDETSTAGPVPLYLLPIALSTEIRRFGGTIREVLIRRGGRHMYAITIRRRRSRRWAGSSSRSACSRRPRGSPITRPGGSCTATTTAARAPLRLRPGGLPPVGVRGADLDRSRPA
ncbi:hypothetical protein CUJ86_02185 [Methanofollis fontis]|uniref:Uncharacterized protein n=2 Tax=Methanofollis fontis TaxID=2052832 RepID=A0A483CV71_9EURY|nr:hypothetical protein CUJ86_02185 [Methanofollis fontis]